MIKIDKNIPAPPSRPGRIPIYPFYEMEIGDSILVKGDCKKIDSARSTSRAYGKRHGMKFSTMLVDGGVRIWRIGVDGETI